MCWAPNQGSIRGFIYGIRCACISYTKSGSSWYGVPVDHIAYPIAYPIAYTDMGTPNDEIPIPHDIVLDLLSMVFEPPGPVRKTMQSSYQIGGELQFHDRFRQCICVLRTAELLRHGTSFKFGHGGLYRAFTVKPSLGDCAIYSPSSRLFDIRLSWFHLVPKCAFNGVFPAFLALDSFTAKYCKVRSFHAFVSEL